MSMTVVAKNKAAKWTPNSAGGDVCGLINMVAGCPVYFPAGGGDDFNFPHIPDSATKAQAKHWSEVISIRLLDASYASKRRARLYGKCKGLFAGKANEFREYVADYAKFLKECGGYRLV